MENYNAAIVQSLQRVKGQGLVFQPPKAAKSRRAISLDSDTVDMLREHRGKQLLKQVELDGLYSDQGPVFPGALGGPIDPSVLTGTF